jgi:hypothetical protein
MRSRVGASDMDMEQTFLRCVSRLRLRLGKEGLDSGKMHPISGGSTGYGQTYAGGRSDGADPTVVGAFREGFRRCGHQVWVGG